MRMTPAGRRLQKVRQVARRRYWTNPEPGNPERLSMKSLAKWMLDPNRKGDFQTYPDRQFDFDQLARALGPMATFHHPEIHVGATVFRVTRQPGGVDVRLANTKPQPSSPDANLHPPEG